MNSQKYFAYVAGALSLSVSLAGCGTAPTAKNDNGSHCEQHPTSCSSSIWGGGGGGGSGGGADVWGGASVVAEGRVLIKHVDALCAALRTCTDTDQFAGVQAKYRRPLDEGGAAALRAAVDAGLDAEALVPVLLAFVSQQLKEDFIGADKPIKEVVGFLDDGHDAFLVDLPWFAHFPGALQMRHVVAAYEELKKLV